MCFWRRKKKTAAVEAPVEEKKTELFDGPFFTIDMVPVVPPSLEDMKPDVKPEEFAVYTGKDKR